MQKVIGGGEGIVGMYGSLTEGAADKVLRSLAVRCGFGPNSVFVDIGAGIAR